MKAGISTWVPVFLRQSIKEGQFFEVEVIDAVFSYFSIGVATAKIWNADNMKISEERMSISGKGQTCAGTKF